MPKACEMAELVAVMSCEMARKTHLGALKSKVTRYPYRAPLYGEDAALLSMAVAYAYYRSLLHMAVATG